MLAWHTYGEITFEFTLTQSKISMTKSQNRLISFLYKWPNLAQEERHNILFLKGYYNTTRYTYGQLSSALLYKILLYKKAAVYYFQNRNERVEQTRS